MSSDGWKVDHNGDGQLAATHQHDRGEAVAAELKQTEQGGRYFECQCGEIFPIGKASAQGFIVG